MIWTAALDQTKLDAAFDARLKAARPYLFGCVKSDKLDAPTFPVEFEEAAQLLEELTAPPLAAIPGPPVPTAPSSSGAPQPQAGS